MLQSALDLLSFYARRLIVRVSLYALIALFSVIGHCLLGNLSRQTGCLSLAQMRWKRYSQRWLLQCLL